MPVAAPTVGEMQDDILHQARARQASIERGDYEVPLAYAPLPLTELLDFLSQWEYRRDALALAVPPPGPGLGDRCSRFCKNLICKMLRWLLIRQVECNTAAIRHARVSAQVAAVTDRNLAELVAAMTHLKLQVHALSERLAGLEAADAGTAEAALWPGDSSNSPECYQAYLEYLKEADAIIVLGCGRGDFLRLLVSEGIPAHGVETEPNLVDFCHERELPVVQGKYQGYLDQIEDSSAGAIFLSPAADVTARDLAPLLASCWIKLRKGGRLIVETSNPQFRLGSARGVRRLPVELMRFLLEGQCFSVVDSLFSRPEGHGMPPVIQTRQNRPFDLRNYRTYAVIGRK
jgi:SAM-dependent methyltransferase